MEPLSGYRLLEPLGRGGFGEVWKCEAPGGLQKAIKFVPGEGAEDGKGEARLGQELDAFQQIKGIRHPFLLTLERVEIIRGELVMVMELADRQLQDRFRECRNCGLPGIPRDELLAYFADAAEALDMIGAKYGLQHLDVKPANLFLVAGHVKLGDYGLVARLDPDGEKSGTRGLTPKYVSPEALRGEPSPQSDQYSLALVYQELLTGSFPYAGRTPQQLMLQHVSGRPDLSGLPPGDQPIVGQALSKDSSVRFGSCLAFVQSLMSVACAATLPTAGMQVRKARVERSMVDMNLPTAEPIDDMDSTGAHPPAEVTQNFTVPGVQGITAQDKRGPLPKLVPSGTPASPAWTGRSATEPSGERPRPSGVVPPASRSRSSSEVSLPGRSRSSADFSSPLINTPAPLSSYIETPAPGRRFAVMLNPIRSIVPVGRLLGLASNELTLSPADYARAVVEFAAGGGNFPQVPGDIVYNPDGTWGCQFPSTVPITVAPIKLGVIRDQWGVTLEQPEPTRLVLRRMSGGGGIWAAFGGGKKSGFEVQIQLPPNGKAMGEIMVTGRLFGSPDREFARQAADFIPNLITGIRRELKNVEDRRKHPRIPASCMVTLYPIHSDGGIDVPIHARCRDVSMGGLCVATEAPLPTKYSYATFDGVGPTAGQAILVRFLRTQPVNRECICGGQYRTDL